MNRFKNILVVYRRTENGNLLLKRAITLAMTNKARLTVADTIGGFLYHIPILTSKASRKELTEHFARERYKQVQEWLSKATRNRMPCKVIILVGTPFLEIVRAVMREHYDLVMLTTEGRPGAKGRFYGRTALHLIRKCPCTVWIVKPNPNKPFSGILAAVDPDPLNTQKTMLNIKIMDLATSLAAQEHCELHVVYSHSPWQDHFLHYTTMSARVIETVTQQLLEQRRKHLDDLVVHYGIGKQVHFLLEEPGMAIPDLIRKQHIKLIVMGTTCQSGLSGLLIGSTAESVLQQVDCSVLAIKPEGFVTPVELTSNEMILTH
ncbi:MAG: universal stress protein [Phycisphaeraceae bacterium]|nr:universal stress protein [Phycisphaeraceae bacterium]